MKLGGVVYILSIEWLIQGWHGLCKSNLSIYLLFEINFRINRIVWSDEPTILWQTTTYYQYLHYWIFVSSWLLSYHIGSDRVGRRKLIFVLKNCFVSFRFVSICLLFVLSLFAILHQPKVKYLFKDSSFNGLFCLSSSISCYCCFFKELTTTTTTMESNRIERENIGRRVKINVLFKLVKLFKL